MSEIMAKIWVSCGKGCSEQALDQALAHVELGEVNKTQLTRWLRQDGWKYTKSYGWICPDCAAKRQTRQSARAKKAGLSF